MTGPDQQCAGTIGDKTFTAACDLTTYQGGFSSNDCQKRYCTGPSDKCLAYTYSLEITGGDGTTEEIYVTWPTDGSTAEVGGCDGVCVGTRPGAQHQYTPRGPM